MEGLMVFHSLKTDTVNQIETEKDKEIKISQDFFFLNCACIWC